MGALFALDGGSGSSWVGSKDAPQWGQKSSLGLTSPPQSEQSRTSSVPQVAQVVSFSPTAAEQCGQRACSQAAHSGAPGGMTVEQRGQARATPNAVPQRKHVVSSVVSITWHPGQMRAPHWGQGPSDGTKLVLQAGQIVQRMRNSPTRPDRLWAVVRF